MSITGVQKCTGQEAGLSGPRHEQKCQQDRWQGRTYKDMSPIGEDMGLPVLEGSRDARLGAETGKLPGIRISSGCLHIQ